MGYPRIITSAQDGYVDSTSGVLTKLITSTISAALISSSAGDQERRVFWIIDTSGYAKRIIVSVEFWVYVNAVVDDAITYYDFLISDADANIGNAIDIPDDWDTLLSGYTFATFGGGGALPSVGWNQIGTLDPSNLNLSGVTNIMCKPNAGDITDGGFITFRMKEHTGGLFAAYLLVNTIDPSFKQNILRPRIFAPGNAHYGLKGW